MHNNSYNLKPEDKSRHELINPALKKAASEKAATSGVWIYDLRTNMHFTLKENPLKFEHLTEFIKCYNSENRFERKEAERFKRFNYEDILKRDKTNLDIFWMKDKSLEDLENLPEPDVIANELVCDLEDALEQLKEIARNLKSEE